MKMVFLIVLPIAAVAIFGELWFQASIAPDTVQRYERRLADHARDVQSAGGRVLLYRALQDRPADMPEHWTAAELAVMAAVFARLERDFPHALESGRVRLAGPDGAQASFALLRGMEDMERDADGDLEVTPARAMGIIFALIDENGRR